MLTFRLVHFNPKTFYFLGQKKSQNLILAKFSNGPTLNFDGMDYVQIKLTDSICSGFGDSLTAAVRVGFNLFERGIVTETCPTDNSLHQRAFEDLSSSALPMRQSRIFPGANI